MADVHVYGIRHHGPGSARAVLAALERDQPSHLAIEMPADLQAMLLGVGDKNLVPPVSLVAYDPKVVSRALYYPLASFSPEWVAMRWAAEREIPIYAIDLPAPLMIAYGSAEAEANTSQTIRSGGRAKRMRIDPLGEMATLAGYTDRERWWERTFELSLNQENIFPAINEMIAELRSAYPKATNGECKLREMHMAREILALEKAGASAIGVVCGAWHGPVLAKAELKQTAKGYAAAKRGLKGPKLQHTWIPWTYERLRTGAGYGAGVESPVWYQLLYEQPGRAAEQYLTRMARELRELGHSASTAQVIDALDLLDSLLDLRNLSLPGINEIIEAAQGALADGSSERLALVRRNVESLRTTGAVPANFANLPLQKDLELRLKETRLSKPYRDMESVEKNIDLRKPAHLAASQLLCQLLLLGIPFGDKTDVARGAKGTFKETWKLHWKPDFALQILSAHSYGQTIHEAAIEALRHRLEQEEELSSLTTAIDLVILAGLFEELDDIANRIEVRATATIDVWEIARAFPALVEVSRYASLRVQETAYLKRLTHKLLPKLAIGLPAACMSIDANAAFEGFTILKKLQPYLGMLDDETLKKQWLQTLETIAFNSTTNPLLVGFALRTLADAGALDKSALVNWFGANLSQGVELQDSAAFVEGFLYSSGLVLIHQPAVFVLLHEWLATLNDEEFRSLLPALKRTFSQFSTSERRKLSALSRRGVHNTVEISETDETTFGDDLEVALRTWLG